MVKSPEDYRWCGYAEAVAGRRPARQGLCAIPAHTSHGVNREITWDYASSVYRVLLFGHGVASEADAQTRAKSRRGFSQERVEEEEKREGKLSIPEIDRIRDLRKPASPGSQPLPLWAVIRCRVRYLPRFARPSGCLWQADSASLRLCDGAIFGSVEFVNGIFEANRWRFGPKRKSGARKLRSGADWGELRTLRDLQVQPVG